MDDLTQLKIVDIYTGKVLRVRTPVELTEWLKKSYKVLTPAIEADIVCLEMSFENDDDFCIKWYGVACGLEITPKKTRRKRS